MPGGDGTGPNGMGAMTGRAAGYCAGYSVPGYVNPVIGRGLGRGAAPGFWGGWGRGAGRGRGFGRGLGFGFGRWGAAYYGNAPYAPVAAGLPTREQELDMLKSQAEGFQGALADVQKRISELESEAAPEA